ncbi:hypothetical protein [Pusillimonas sp. ANT_WB101]|uniref:hypothetical protein n=1 Tax=Pusillimonas sp. ANT_WB101 TaxID=2597356 RepID=UPI001259347D|nr:hypothetical protein [Pusillimonas sp. ANT_WB101]KAA0889329.1 hypothetical protein FQ179_19355 [Pusillimonas sp. ANT_WB101]
MTHRITTITVDMEATMDTAVIAVIAAMAGTAVITIIAIVTTAQATTLAIITHIAPTVVITTDIVTRTGIIVLTIDAMKTVELKIIAKITSRTKASTIDVQPPTPEMAAATCSEQAKGIIEQIRQLHHSIARCAGVIADPFVFRQLWMLVATA